MKKIIPFLLCAFLFSCKNNQTHIVDYYYLVSVDGNENTSIGYSDIEDRSATVDVIPECVYAAGFNKNYIIAKRHPLSINRRLMKEKTLYYIIPIGKEYTYFPEKGVLGPMEENEFKKEAIALGISGIPFSIVLNELE